jgi:hypothetical protein
MKKKSRKIITLEVETTLTNKEMRYPKFWNDVVAQSEIGSARMEVKQVQINAIHTDPENKFDWVKEY